MKKKKAIKKEDIQMTEYIYTFDFIKHYPNRRSFIVKKPLKTSMGATLKTLVFGGKE
jgi:hypothetical protein